MSLVVVSVPRIIEAAAALDKLDPNRELKDHVNQALRLSAVQNGIAGTVTIPDSLAARVDELLGSPQQTSSELPDSQTPDSSNSDSNIDELDTYDE